MGVVNVVSCLRNAGLSKKTFTNVQLSKMNINFLDILYSEGFINGYSISDDSRKIKVYPSYAKNELALVSSLKSISTPGRRVYLGYRDLVKFYSGRFLILSTSKGLMTGTTAIINKTGGEFICLRYYF